MKKVREDVRRDTYVHTSSMVAAVVLELEVRK